MSLATLLSQVERIDDINDIEGFKNCVKASYQWLAEDFDNNVLVDELVHGRATFVDALICKAWSLLKLHDVKNLALCAVGGYGRGQLQPHSDVDLLILSEKSLKKEVQER